MTRINHPIPPDRLCDQHLLAEYYEMVRCSTSARKYQMQGKEPNDCLALTHRLNTGHVRFWTARGGTLAKRFKAIKQELHRRGIRCRNWWRVHPAPYRHEWVPDATEHQQAVDVMTERITQRMPDKPRFGKKEVTKKEAIKRLIHGV